MSYVSLTCEDGIGIIRMDRPPVNAMDSTLVGELTNALEQSARDPAIRVLVITSSLPNVFSAGADIRQLEQSGPQGCRDFIRLGQGLCNQLEGLPKPVIAAVRGTCLGGGCELAMACDFRVAGRSSRLGQPEVNLGIVPGWGGTQRLPRLIGKTQATEKMMLGEHISAEEAQTLGLVNRVVEDDEVLNAAMGLARQLLAKSSVSLGAIKGAVQEGLRKPLMEGLEVEEERFIEAYSSEDGREGIRAFLEKRAPRFTGR